jgi:hypothetical protein
MGGPHQENYVKKRFCIEEVQNCIGTMLHEREDGDSLLELKEIHGFHVLSPLLYNAF